MLLKRDRVMEAQALSVAIVGGGPGCKAIMDIMFAEKLSELKMMLVGVACTNPHAVGYRYAQEKRIYTTTDYHDLYGLKNLGMIIELTGRDGVADEIARTKPEHIRLMDHLAARLFWDVFRIEEQRLKERRRIQEALVRSEKRYRELYEGSRDGYAMVNMAGKIIECNSSFQEMLGYSKEELFEKTYEDVTPEKWHSAEAEILGQQVFKRGYSVVYEKEFRRKDGTIFPIQIRTYLFRDDPGEPMGMWAWVRDVTEGKKAETALRESERFLESVFEGIRDGISVLDRDLHIVRVNRWMEKMYASEMPLVGRKCYEVYQKRTSVCPWCPSVRTLQTGRPHTETVPYPFTKEPTGGWIELSSFPLKDAAGQVRGVIEHVKDITGRKRTEEALRESEEKFRLAFENAVDAIFWADLQTGLITLCNKAAEALLEKAKNQIIGQHQTKLHPPESADYYARMFREHIEKQGSVSDAGEIVTKTGKRKPVHITASVTLVGGKPMIQGVFRDITYQKEAEKALVKAKEDWENTFDAITDMVMLLDSEHHIIRVNKAAAEALNTTKEKLVGKKCYEAVHRQSHPIRKCPLVHTMKTSEPCTVEIVDSDLGGTFICTTSPMLNHEGRPVGYTHCLKDISKLKRLEAQFQQAQKMEAIGTLAGGIAHDFNNLLMGIQGRTSLMLMHVDSDHPHFIHLKGIEDAIQRGADLSKQLLGFARGGKYEVKVTDLNSVVERSSEMFARTRKEMKIHKKYQQDLWATEIDRGQIEQMLLNLYVNAWQAMPGGGDLYLETGNVTFDRQSAKPFNVDPGNYVKLSVTDTGVGMDEATRQRVFEPFFTTKEVGGGTGLGLASAFGIIKNHGGAITVYSEPGHGATFDIYLPASEKAVTKEKEPSAEVLRGSERVLLIDDEGMILDVGKEMLTALGYKAMLAGSGREAIGLYKENQDKIEIVILDMIMPDMNGGEVYDTLKEINPKVRVLLSSGYSIDGEANEIMKRGCDGFVQKPFNMKQLSVKIREILDKPQKALT